MAIPFIDLQSQYQHVQEDLFVLATPLK